jgi:7-carboxy-7-deazaguanine synthase
VILSENDYCYARNFLAQHDLHRHVDEVIFSPVFDRLSPRTLAEWILRDGLEVRLGLQIHKFIWGAEVRGV